jgi:hypothetical protein
VTPDSDWLNNHKARINGVLEETALRRAYGCSRQEAGEDELRVIGVGLGAEETTYKNFGQRSEGNRPLGTFRPR